MKPKVVVISLVVVSDRAVVDASVFDVRGVVVTPKVVVIITSFCCVWHSCCWSISC